MSKASAAELRNKISSNRVGLLVRGSTGHSTKDDLVELLNADYSKFNGILDEEIALFVISHPEVPLEWAGETIAGRTTNINPSGLKNIREAAASNPHMPARLLKEIRMHEGNSLDWAISANPNLNDSLIEDIIDSCPSYDWSHSGGIIYTLAKNPTLENKQGAKLVAKIFDILDSEDGNNFQQSISATALYVYDDLNKKKWFTPEQESRVLLIAACS